MAPPIEEGDRLESQITECAWGIDVRDRSVVAVKLGYDAAADRFVGMDFARISLPAAPDAAEPGDRVGASLAALDERHNLRDFPVALAIPGRAGLVKFIRIPPVEDKILFRLVQYEAKLQVHPLPLKDVAWDFQKLDRPEAAPEGEAVMDEVALFAVRSDQLRAAILPFDEAAVEVDMAQFRAVALANYATFELLPDLVGRGPIILIDIGAETSEVVLTDGARFWHRSLPVGGDHFTQALAERLKLPLAKAETMKLNAARVKDPSVVYAPMLDAFNKLADEVRRSIDSFMNLTGPVAISKVFALGGGSKLPGLVPFLQERLAGFPVERAGMPAKFSPSESMKTSGFRAEWGSAAVACGMAVQALGRGPFSVNLIPAEMRPHRSRPKSSALLRFARRLMSR